MIELAINGTTHIALRAHLFPSQRDRPGIVGDADIETVEQAAFLLTERYAGSVSLSVADLRLMGPDDFEIQTGYHISLRDEVRAELIQWAHAREGCLIEAHTHEHRGTVAFSASDLRGFEDWVWHMRWRLRWRPYIALVFGYDTFDALVWLERESEPQPLSGLITDGRVEAPTNATCRQLRLAREEHAA